MLILLGIPVELDVPGKLYDLFAKNGLIATTVVFIAAFFGLLRVHLSTSKEHTRELHKVITELRDDYADMRSVAKDMIEVVQQQARKPRQRRKPETTQVTRKVALSDD